MLLLFQLFVAVGVPMDRLRLYRFACTAQSLEALRSRWHRMPALVGGARRWPALFVGWFADVLLGRGLWRLCEHGRTLRAAN